MVVELRWRAIGGEKDARWKSGRCVYAYLAPRTREVLYIGKAWGRSTVRSRWKADDKAGFWDDLEEQRGILKHAVLVGEVWQEEGERLTKQLLADVESLLIKRVQPWGNIQAKESRISRPGLRVRCTGRAWLGGTEYRDS